MKRVVTVTFTVDPTEYSDAEDSDQGAVDLAVEILKNRADWPENDNVVVACNNARKELEWL